MISNVKRRIPVGVELLPSGGVHARVWAPSRRRVRLVVDGRDPIDMKSEEGGYFAAHAAYGRAGSRYGFSLGDDEKVYPDPASRFQPDGPHGLSEVIDPDAYAWAHPWRGAAARGQVIYELHVGTFTAEGTYASAAEKLPRLAELDVTLVELMPIHAFPGRFGWGYDGVDLYAPVAIYGRPDELRRFVDAAHGLGLGVILDVVYNHLGPDGNYLSAFAPQYFTDKYENDWGQAIAFEGREARGSRELFVENAGYWIDEYHLDGLRFDATQCIHDASDEHVLGAMARRARAAAGGRPLFLVAESETQTTVVVRAKESGGYGFTALWNDDLHHAARVAVTGRGEAYYTDYRGTPQELISAARWGYLFQGQRYAWQKQRRGTPALDLPATSFVSYVQNHDQVANSGRGERLHALTTPGRLRAITAYLLLGPATPMLFQGQEFAASSPFLFFADHEPDLARKVHAGRKEFLRQFPSLAAHDAQARIDDPAAAATFDRCKLDWSEREANVEVLALHRDLLALRRGDPIFAAQRADRMHGAVLAPEAFVLRFFGDAGDDRLLVVNLGPDIDAGSLSEPLVAPPEGRRWSTRWSSEAVKYGGAGAPPIDTDRGWRIPGHAAIVLEPRDRAAVTPRPGEGGRP